MFLEWPSRISETRHGTWTPDAASAQGLSRSWTRAQHSGAEKPVWNEHTSGCSLGLNIFSLDNNLSVLGWLNWYSSALENTGLDVLSLISLAASENRKFQQSAEHLTKTGEAHMKHLHFFQKQFSSPLPWLREHLDSSSTGMYPP